MTTLLQQWIYLFRKMEYDKCIDWPLFLFESSSQIKTVPVLQLSMNLTHIYILHIENFKNKRKTSVKWNMLNKISFRIIFFFPGEMISHQLHTNLRIWFHWDTVYRVIFVTCYFHPSSLAYSFALIWICLDKVVFKEKKYEHCNSSSPKFTLWQRGLKEQK